MFSPEESLVLHSYCEHCFGNKLIIIYSSIHNYVQYIHAHKLKNSIDKNINKFFSLINKTDNIFRFLHITSPLKLKFSKNSLHLIKRRLSFQI